MALITLRSFNNAGLLFTQKTPEEMLILFEYDGLGRVRKVTENYVYGGSAPDQNRIREFEYDAMGRIVIQKATSAAVNPQVTEYIYGVADGIEGSKISSEDLLFQIRHPGTYCTSGYLQVFSSALMPAD